MTSGHRLDTERPRQRVRVIVGGETVADSRRAVVLHETGLPTRYYLPADDVRTDLLTRTDTASTCPFKGDAIYWSIDVGEHHVDDVAWSYPTPIADRRDIARLVSFYAERVDELWVDDTRLARPDTPWSPAAS